LTRQLPDLYLADSVGFTAQGCRPVEASVGAALTFLAGFQIAPALKGMQHRIERTRTQRVAVAGEVLDHPLAVEFLFRGVMKDVHPDQADQQVLMLHSRHYRPAMPRPPTSGVLSIASRDGMRKGHPAEGAEGDHHERRRAPDREQDKADESDREIPRRS